MANRNKNPSPVASAPIVGIVEADFVNALWADNPQRCVKVEDLEPHFADYLQRGYLPLWNAACLSDWHGKRIRGLEAYALYEARFRLGQYHKDKFTELEWKQWHLQDSKNLPDPYYNDLVMEKKQTNAVDFFGWVGKVLSQKGNEPNWNLKVFAFFYDRAPIPLEFWTNNAAANLLTRTFRKQGRNVGGDGFTRDQVKQWKRRELKLKETKPFIVTNFHEVSGDMDFNLEAAKKHGLPLPSAA